MLANTSPVFAGMPDLLLCPRVMGQVSGQGWQSHRPGSVLLALPLKQEGAPNSLPCFPFPGPMPAHRQEANCQQERFRTVGSWDRMAPPPPAAKGPLHSRTSTLSSGKGLPSSLSFILWACTGCQGSRQLLLPNCLGGLGMLKYPTSRMFPCLVGSVLSPTLQGLPRTH